jgi:3' terminal RNA ribose 2'-O-methyltransferase Hen1
MWLPRVAGAWQDGRVLLTITTTHHPATDLGYLLVKHPDRVHTASTSVGTAHVLYPEATEQRCTAALLLEVEPAKLAKLRDRGAGFALSQYVNDRPYAASSLLSVAMSRVFSSALKGASRDRPELAGTAIPLELRVPALSCVAGPELVERVFAPLGWQVEATPVPLVPAEWGDSRYLSLTLRGTLRLADALNHLYVLLPVLDGGKHYWVTTDEVDKLLRAGTGWLAGHPDRDLIADRYLAHQRALTRRALDQLSEEDGEDEPIEEEAELPAGRARPLAQRRRDAVLAVLAESGARRVLDLGCGSGALLVALARDPRYTELVGADVSSSALSLAERRLERLADRQRDRITVLQTALTYADARLTGYDAAVLMEVIEHVDEPRLPALARAVFGNARPGTVVVTTPNVEYNVRYPALAAEHLRHPDHRFEWTRNRFAAWASEVGGEYGYTVDIRPVGDEDAEVGAPTQMAVFGRVA